MAEIDKQSQFFHTCSQVINQLPLMLGSQVNNRFKFNNNFIFNYHVWHIMPYNLSFIIDIYRFLALALQPTSL